MPALPGHTSEQRTGNKPKTPLDTKSPIQVRIRLAPAKSLLRTRVFAAARLITDGERSRLHRGMPCNAQKFESFLLPDRRQRTSCRPRPTRYSGIDSAPDLRHA